MTPLPARRIFRSTWSTTVCPNSARSESRAVEEIDLTTRSLFFDLAASGLRMPIGADLVLNEERDPEHVRQNGAALGRIIERAARRWNTPIAMSLMDLRLE